MKIQKVSEELKAEIKKLRDSIAEQLQILASKDKSSQALTKRVSDLQAEIASLEAASPDDSAAIRQLTDKRTEFELLQRQIEAAVDPKIHDQVAMQTEPLNRLLIDQARKLLPQALKPTSDHYLNEIVPAFRPFCLTDAEAISLAFRTSAAGFLGRMFATGWGAALGNPIIQGKQVIEICDGILKGEIPSFDPQIKK